MPLDPDPNEAGNVIVRYQGGQLSCTVLLRSEMDGRPRPNGITYRTHWATCPSVPGNRLSADPHTPKAPSKPPPPVQPGLFDAPAPDIDREAWQRARLSDPSTSLAAAGSLNAQRLTATREAILTVLREHPDGLTDADIADRYHGPEASPSGLRTRRSELCDLGLVADTGRRQLLTSGRHAIVWSHSQTQTKESNIP